ncbi:pleckstrin homology domain-containing family G member 5-like isoform X5 [Oscarella lobularis]|uniref:pleckstrin homology domain-containing family G member 5-like isoform X5 n=1 Tax=Oscarella lobularis TaxID=121494 RepID=UPI00331410FF
MALKDVEWDVLEASDDDLDEDYHGKRSTLTTNRFFSSARSDFDYADDDNDMRGGVAIHECQNSQCRSAPENSYPTRVCHHIECQETNGGRPYCLCTDCDELVHRASKSSHVRFNFTPADVITRDTSDYSDLDSLPTSPLPSRRATPDRHMSLADRLGAVGGRRLRKKKPTRRHNTDDLGKEWFALRIGVDDEVIPVLRSQTLREAVQPAFERHQISFQTASVYLRSSTTPLEWSFETYCLGGQTLRVEVRSPNLKAKSDKGLMSTIVRHLTRPKSPQVSQRKDKDRKFKEHFFKNADRLAVKRSGSFDDLDIRRSNSIPGSNTRRGSGRKDIRLLLGVGVDDGTTPPPPGTDTDETTTTTQLDETESSSHTTTTTTTTTTTDGKQNGVVGHTSSTRQKKLQAMLGSGFSSQAGRTLADQLELFSVYGLPGYDGEKIDLGRSEETRLGSWKDHVLGVESMLKRECDLQEAIWELLSTEESYMLALKAVLEVFYVCLQELKREKFLDIETEELFGNIAYVYSSSKSFWEKRLKPMVDGCKETRERIDPLQVVNALTYFDEDLEPYEEFCVREKNCVEYLTAQKKESVNFKAYLEWCESQPRCRRMKLADLLVKPMHRLIQYPLLLKAILKKSDDEEAIDKLLTVVERVECFLNRVNSMVGRKGQEERLSTIQAMISGYVGFECPPDLEKHFVNLFTLDLLSPMPGVPEFYNGLRDIYQEGSLKLKDSLHTLKSAKSDVHAFLFTDLFLLTTRVKKNRVKLLQQPMRVDRLVCEKLKDPFSFLLIYLNEYRFPVSWYLFQVATAEQAKQWMEALQDAQLAYANACRGLRLRSPPNGRRNRLPSVSSTGSWTSRAQSFSRTPSPGASPSPCRRCATMPLSNAVRQGWSASPSSSPLPTHRTTSHALPSLLVTESAAGSTTLTEIKENEVVASMSNRRSNGEGSGTSETSLDRLLDALPDSSCDENESLSDASSLASDRRSLTLPMDYVASPLVGRRPASLSSDRSAGGGGDAAARLSTVRTCGSCNELDRFGKNGSRRRDISSTKFIWQNREISNV